MTTTDNMQMDDSIMQMQEAAVRYLVQKPVLMNNPGTKLDDIYYSSMNTKVELAETTYNNGRLEISLPSLSFGGTSQIQIPNSSLLSAVYLHLSLDLGNQANVTLPRGWGYAAIQSLAYLMGSSNANQYQITGQSLWQVLSGQCETAEKRSEMYHLGGEEVLSASGVVTCDILLPLPWSNACGLYEKLPIDTNLFRTPIYITLMFNPAQNFIGGSGVKPTAFSGGSILCRMGDLSNKDQSLNMIMSRDPTKIYGYPFINTQSFTLQDVTQFDIDRPLNSIINADLVGISIGVVRASDVIPTGGSTPNPFNYQDLRDIQLLYNGQVMANFPGNAYKLQSMHSSPGATYWFNSVVAAGAVAPYSSAPVNSYPIFFDFSRKRTAAFPNEFPNVWRIANNTLQFKAKVASGINTNYNIYVTYYYNSIADIQNGESRIIM